ncbi:hypothetical protein [Nocardia veterana]|uniref:Protein RecA n=1 Tax=Nocardia veterana TaxID=132249 RepID=A0A7X6M353_9NOCA|nr:hypothetical protein [Nocardia veterana]NKY88861.1 hypothetical protein [Nocardia veterana]
MFESNPGRSAGARLDPALAAMPMGRRLDELRRRMAAIPGKVGADAPATIAAHDLLPIPGPLGELLPSGGLMLGTVVACPRGAITSAILAAATNSGHQTAIVGEQFDRRRPSLIDIWEMGGTIERVALVDASGADPAEIVSVLVDGVPVVVLAIPGLRLTPSQVETLRARVRGKRGLLVVTEGSWARQPHMTIGCRLRGVGGIGRGVGRVSRIEMDVDVTSGQYVRSGRLVLAASKDGRSRWIPAPTPAGLLRLAHTG